MEDLAKKVINKLSNEEKEDLLFIILYGSSVEREGRDYDLIIVFGDQHGVRGEINDDVDVRYSVSEKKLRQIVQTSINMYSILTEEDAHKVIYGEKAFTKFKESFLDSFKPSFKDYKRLMLRKGKLETLIKGLKEREGERATIWAFHSIRSLLQLIYLKKKNKVTRDMERLVIVVKKSDRGFLKTLKDKFENKEALSVAERVSTAWLMAKLIFKKIENL